MRIRKLNNVYHINDRGNNFGSPSVGILSSALLLMPARVIQGCSLMFSYGPSSVLFKCFQKGVSEVGLLGAQEGKGVAGKSHQGSSGNERHPSQDLGIAAKSF
ncbi:hypothetical protein GOODEAATRI_033351 [Goodea atripinnis]|uniref:Uncharacterized protein n=1 Tax=Goodea atripinnis TaxID=208336 RepID=A0ABV0PTN8_9TELE